MQFNAERQRPGRPSTSGGRRDHLGDPKPGFAPQCGELEDGGVGMGWVRGGQNQSTPRVQERWNQAFKADSLARTGAHS